MIEKGKSPGPILCDIDFRFSEDHTKRLYKKIHIDQLFNAYLDVLSRVFEMDEDTRFPVFIMEKPAPRLETSKTNEKYVKDGIHIIIGLSVELA